MKKLLFILFQLYVMIGFGQSTEVSINISLPTKPSANINEWAKSTPPLIIVLQNKNTPNQEKGSKEYKTLVTINSNGSKVCGKYTSKSAPSFDFNTQVKTWSGDAALGLLGSDCILKPGQYEFCVQIYNLENRLVGESCKPFAIADTKVEQINYTSPTLISPQNEAVFTEQETKKPLTFRWTPLVPKPKENVTYRLKVWQLMEGQTKSVAINANQPILTKEVENVTQAVISNWIGPCRFPYLCEFAWIVEAVNVDGKAFASSEPSSFKINASYFLKNISPINNSIISFNDLDSNLKFRWETNINTNNKINTYKLNFWKIDKKENVNTYVKNHLPNRIVDVSNTNEWESKNEVFLNSISISDTSSFIVWNANLLDGKNKVIMKSEVTIININEKKLSNEITLNYPSPYCPTLEERPKFYWNDLSKEKSRQKSTYSLKLVELNSTDTSMVDFENRKTVFEKNNLKNDALLFPSEVPDLKMNILYGWKVKKVINNLIVSESEAFPFYILDKSIPLNIREMICCTNNLIKNGEFLEGTTAGVMSNTGGKSNGWQKGYGRPMVIKADDGCGSPNYIKLSGNKEYGSSITQKIKLKKGKHYKLTACVRVSKDNNKSDYAYFNAVAFNGNLPNSGTHPISNSEVTKIGWSGKIKSKEWVTFSMNVWSPNKDFDNIAIYCSSQSGKIDIVGEIDKICLQETKDSIYCDDFAYNSNGQLELPVGLSTNISNIDTTYYESNNGPVSSLYGQTTNGVDALFNFNGPCSSIGGTIPIEVTNFNIDDSLKLMGFPRGRNQLDSILNQTIVDTTSVSILPQIPPITNEKKCGPFVLDKTQPFDGRDIIFVHGLNNSHLCENAKNIMGADKIWPNDISEFCDLGGYFKEKARDVWADHIQTWLRSKGYKNRVLVVSYNCNQRAKIAAHAILGQIREAMENGRGVEFVPGDKREKNCFGRDAVIISHSTGGLVSNIAMSIANRSKFDSEIQSEFGNIGFVSDNIKAHIAFDPALSGSRMANIMLAAQLDHSITAGILQSPICYMGTSEAKARYASIALKSILIDLQTSVAQFYWKTIIEASPVPTITLSGGHFFGVDGAGVLNIGIHPGFDDGVVTMSCQAGNPNIETGFRPSGYFFNPLQTYKVFDMGIQLLRAGSYFNHQKLFTGPGYAGSGAIAHLSPSGMVQPIGFLDPISNPNNRINNHYSFIQSATDHYVGPRGKSVSEGYNRANHIGTTGFNPPCFQYATENGMTSNEESLAIISNEIFSRGLVNPMVIPKQVEITRGEYIDFDVLGPQFSFKCCPPKFKIWWGPMFHVRIPIWERKYHLMDDYQCESVASYAYKYILKN